MYLYAQNLEENNTLKKMISICMVKLKGTKSTICLGFWFGWIGYCFVGEI